MSWHSNLLNTTTLFFGKRLNIIWGSTTLLLGFVLEAIKQEPFLSLATAFLSIFVTLMVQFLTLAFKKTRDAKYAICQKIESKLKMEWQQHNLMNTAAFPRGVQTRWYIATTIALIIVWLFVVVRSVCLLRHS